jgi:hypothetical protein
MTSAAKKSQIFFSMTLSIAAQAKAPAREKS